MADQIYWKIFWTGFSGILSSITKSGRPYLKYTDGKNNPPDFLKSKGYYLLAFRERSQAEKYLSELLNRNSDHPCWFPILPVTGVEMPLKPPLNISLLMEGILEEVPGENWPEGTVAIKDLEILPGCYLCEKRQDGEMPSRPIGIRKEDQDIWSSCAKILEEMKKQGVAESWLT